MAEERRLVTVLFADVVESTELGESLDPEDLRAILGAYYALAKDVIAHYGGTPEKFIGDAVMAVFGLPAAHGDDPQRALSAALEIRSRLQADPRLAGRLRVRFGINTGEVVAVVDPSAGDFLITGDAVTVAARLQQSAQPWAILAGERTVHASGASFKFGPAIDVEAKGKPGGVRAAQLVGRDTGTARLQTPFVGRVSDLAQLELLGRRALVERRPTVVSIIAPAGTGKTRLLEEFLGRLHGIAADARVVTGQCLPYGERLTYWPLRSMLLQLVGAAPGASPDEIRAALERWLGEADRSGGRTAEILAGTIGAGEGGPPPDRLALQTAWRSTLHLAATRAPLVVVLEDVHWASDSLLDLMGSIEPRDAVPLLVVALTRPELLDRRPGWGGGRRDYTAMTLEPLAPSEVEALVRQLLTHGSARVVKQIVARAEGNPFYAVELVRMLTDRAALTDPLALEHALATLPDTVQAAVLERLDLLGHEERRVMQLGSVLGRSFTAEGIVALANELAPTVDAALELLLAKDLLRPAGGDGFAFRHILINEVAYQTLARAERGRLHAAAGRWLEDGAGRHAEALAEIIAHHYREAVTLSRTAIAAEPPPELRAKAVLWLERAADVALKGAAHVEAVRHLRAATELADRDRLADLYERIGDAFVSGDAVEAYRHVLQVSRGDVNRSADRELRAIAGMLHVSLRSGGSAGGGLSHEEIAALRQQAEELLRLDVSEAAIAHFLVAESFEPFAIARGDERAPTEPQLARAEEKATRALKIADHLDDTKLRSAALDGLGSVQSLRGDHGGARELARQRIAMGTALDLVERLDAYAVATWLSVWLGELDDAIATSAEGLALVQPGQATSWTLHLVSWRALALMRRGRWDEALTAGERARVLWIEGGRTAAVFALHGFLAALAVAHARADRQLFARFREPLDEIGSRAHRLPPPRRLDFLSDDESQPDHYLRHFNQRQPEALELGLAFASDAGRPPAPRLLHRLAASDRMRSLPLLAAEVRRAQGLAERDAAALAEAAASFEARGAVPSAARAHCEHARLVDDDVELRAGLAVLADLGDVTQRDRYRSRSRV